MIKKIIIGIILNALALYGVVYFLDSSISYTGGAYFFIIGGILIGLLNTLVKPILKLVTLPLHLLTLGLSLIALNGIIFWLFDQSLDALAIEGITLTINDLSTYLFAGILFGLINWVEHLLFGHS